MALFKPSMGPLVRRCSKNVIKFGKCLLHRRATFFTGSSRQRMAQLYQRAKCRSDTFTVGHDQKVRKTSLSAQAREVCKLRCLRSPNRSACDSGRFSCPYSQRFRVFLSWSLPCSCNRRCSLSRTSFVAFHFRWRRSFQADRSLRGWRLCTNFKLHINPLWKLSFLGCEVQWGEHPIKFVMTTGGWKLYDCKLPLVNLFGILNKF